MGRDGVAPAPRKSGLSVRWSRPGRVADFGDQRRRRQIWEAGRSSAWSEVRNVDRLVMAASCGHLAASQGGLGVCWR
ncbi:extensin [Iris pallida]|uniref:Extensin n=1 Tax=Iris pallida TaxID=29817 RepID=A0AAX6H6P3_IRIPA|nr:extensin [Iris pallida]